MLARWKGNVTTHAVGFVASIATVIMMAGKKVVADENCFCLIHNPWTFVQGNANDLQKEIQNLEKCREAMMGFYRKHSKISDEELTAYLDEETWFTGAELSNVFDVEVLPNDERLDIAAKFDLSKYKTLPRGLTMKNEEKIETTEETKVEEPVETQEETVKEEVKEELKEEKSEEPDQDDIEELRKTIEILKEENEQLKAKLAECEKQKAELEEEKKEETTEEETVTEEEPKEEEIVTKAQVEKRISGIQASMQKQINDFKGQLKAKEEELMKAKAEITHLSDSLEQVANELSETASILDEKTQALEKLNANVNQAPEELPTFEEGLKKCSSPAERVAFIRSGKYIRQVG